MIKSNDFNDIERAEWQHEDLASVKIRVYHGHKDKVSSVHFCTSNNKILSSSFDKTCKIWNLSTGNILRTFESHKSFINYCELNKNESQFLSCGWDSNLMIWDTETGQIPLTMKFGGIVSCSRFSSTDNLVVVGSDLDNLVTIVDIKSGKKIKSIKGLHSSTPTSCRFITSDNRILTTSMDRTCKIYDLRTDSATITLEDHSNIVSSADMSINEHILVTGSWDKSLLVYDINSGSYRLSGPVKLTDGHEGSVSCCYFSKDGNLLISGGYDSNIVIWDMTKQVKDLKLQGHIDWVEDVKISNDNNWILSCSKDHTIRLWNIEQTEKLSTPSLSNTKASRGVQIFENKDDFSSLGGLECPKCGKKYKGTDDAMCVFCRLDSDSNASMNIVKQRFSLMSI